MKETLMKKLMFAVLTSIAAIGAAQAQTTTVSGPRPYVGLGAATVDYYSDGYKTHAKLFGGVELDQNWGIEAGYTHIEKQKFARADATRSISGSTKGYDSYVAGKYSLPVSERFAAYGKLGLAHSQRKYENSWGERNNDTDTGAYAAIGAEYKLTSNVALQAEYERYGRDKPSGAKADVWTVGAKYSF
jgi:OOP family OmpA-OmpF porin